MRNMNSDMRKILLAAGLLLCALGASAAGDETLRVLAVGDSFTEGIVRGNLCGIALADRKDLVVGSLSAPGEFSLAQHAEAFRSGSSCYDFRHFDVDGVKSQNMSACASEALAADKWDVVTLQQSVSLAGIPESYDALAGLVDAIKAMLPDAKIYLLQTWAYSAFTLSKDFGAYGNSMPLMWKALSEATASASKDAGIGVIPCGAALQNLRSTTLNENFTTDGRHLNAGIGRYVASCAFYGAVSGRRTAGNNWRPGHITDENAVLAQLAADAAVDSPFEKSDIGFKVMRDNRVESRVADHPLPDPLIMADGRKVSSKKQWEARRKELLELFTTQIYGRMPSTVDYFETEVLETETSALDGLATRKRVAVYLSRDHSVWIDLLVYTPNSARGGRSPMFLGVNFWGNSCCTMEEDVLPANDAEKQRYGIFEQLAKGANARRWPLREILSRGYGVATFYRGDVCPDFDDTGATGVRSLYPKKNGELCGPDEWGAVSAWAWGLSRAMDYLVTDKDVDPARVAVIGHSRLGKTALWAGANDSRFAMVVSNDSGCTGAKIARRNFGESVKMINWHFPHWFCDNYDRYNNNPETLPVDQHELIALCAPRPVCVGSAVDDLNADPKGEKMALEAAAPVYRLWGKDAVGRLNYHIRPGGHDIILSDWNVYLDHADKYMKGKSRK